MVFVKSFSVDPATTTVSAASWLLRKQAQSAQTQPESFHCVINEFIPHCFSNLQIWKPIYFILFLKILLYVLYYKNNMFSLYLKNRK